VLDLFGGTNHFPDGGKNCFITLLLPEIDIKLPVGGFASDDAGREFTCLVLGLIGGWTSQVVTSFM
jgi:hypothetical protein